MSFFDGNLSILKHAYPKLYSRLLMYQDAGNIFAGDAADGEIFLAIQEKGSIVPLASIYNPKHEAERFMHQFEEDVEKQNILVFGFNSGEIVRQILDRSDIFHECAVYEPSVDIFYKCMQDFDLTDILNNPRCKLFLSGDDREALYTYLDETMDYINWEYYRYVVLPCYRKLYSDSEKLVHEIYVHMIELRNLDQRLMIAHAQKCTSNEILSFQWLINGKSFFEISSHIPNESVCIIVAAGPSLEKNVQELKKAKGKAVIFCVDTVLSYLIHNGIEPDMICTIDPEKSSCSWDGLEQMEIPIVLSPESDQRFMNGLRNPKVLCFSTANAYHQSLFQKAGYDIPYYYAGSSVATTCFKLAADIGFHTIIFAGQDLALHDNKIHAGGEENEETICERLEVDGYYGGKVTTLEDYKMFLDWYEIQIPKYPTVRVINSTEGGARIKGTVQMPLSDAIQECCVYDMDFNNVFLKTPYIWDTIEKRENLYRSLKYQLQFLAELLDNISCLITEYEHAIHLFSDYQLSGTEAIKLEKDSQSLLQKIEGSEISMLISKRIIKAKLTMRRKMFEASKREDRDMQVMKIMLQYLTELERGVREMHDDWENVIHRVDTCKED